jgi:ABC-type transport system involved in multi-copper enzyme maturation permease subunit
MIATTRTIAALTLTRVLRGKTLWIGLIISVLPVAFALILRAYISESSKLASQVLAFEMLLLAVLPAMFVGASVGEDIEDRTATYLWSRPVPREAVLAGKLLALVPIAVVLVVASWAAAGFASTAVAPPVESLAGVAAGTAAVCLVATGIATLVPKHGTALTIVYMLLFDLPIGVLPASLRYLSTTHLARAIADPRPSDPPLVCAVALAIIGAIWLIVGILRIRRMEV